MSTETNTQAATEPAAVAPPAAPVVAAPVITPTIAEPAKPGAKVEMTSDELKRRLDETRAKTRDETRLEFLKSFGVSDEAALKTAIAEQKRLEDEKRTDLEKRDARIKDLEPKAMRADELESIVKAYADEQAAGLTDAMRATVDQLGGDDPAKRLSVIKALRSGLPAAPLAAPPIVRPPVVAPVTTAPTSSAPPAAGTGAAVDHLAVLASLEGNPIRQANYMTKHRAAIVAARKARGEYVA